MSKFSMICTVFGLEMFNVRQSYMYVKVLFYEKYEISALKNQLPIRHGSGNEKIIIS